MMSLYRTISTAVTLASILLCACGTPQKKAEPAFDPMAGDPVIRDVETKESDKDNAAGLKTVNFALRSADLTTEAKAILDRNAMILKRTPHLIIQIEGHCDDRGTVERNLLIGDQRARAVVNYLVKKGVSKNSLSAISYGKNKPLAEGISESARSKNRRVNFLVLAS